MKDRRPRPVSIPGVSIGRRKFLRSVPAALAAGVAAPALAQQPGQQEPARFGKDALKASRADPRPRLPRRRRGNDAARRQPQPRLLRHPSQAGHPAGDRAGVRVPSLPAGQASRARPADEDHRGLRSLRRRRQGREALDDLAFLPITALAPLIESRRITSTALTKMYLARLRRYGDRSSASSRSRRSWRWRRPRRPTRRSRRALPRAAARHPLGRQGPACHQGHPGQRGARSRTRTRSIDLDATVVERLREAGAVLWPSSRWARWRRAAVWFGGTTKNPWNTEREFIRADRPQGRRPPPRRAWWASRSAPRRWLDHLAVEHVRRDGPAAHLTAA